MAKKKTKQCPDCGKEISQSAKRCPYCDAKQKGRHKILKIVVAILVLLILIGSCSDEEETKTPVSESEELQTVQENETEAKKETKEETSEPVIKEQVIYEGNNVVITAKGIESSGSDWEIKLLIENNSKLNLGFNAHAYAVNGIMTGNNIYDMDCDVAAGKKANVSLELKGRVLNEYGITNIRCVDALFWAYDNDKSFKEFDTGQIEIKTSLYNKKHDVIKGDTLYDNDGIKVDFIGSDDNEFTFAVKNTTGNYIEFDVEEITINGFTVSDIDYDLYGIGANSDCQAIYTISVDNQFMQDNDIDKVETVEHNLTVRTDGKYTDKYKVGPIEYTVK